MLPGPAASASPGNLLEMQTLKLLPRLAESETLGWAQQSGCQSASQVTDALSGLRPTVEKLHAKCKGVTVTSPSRVSLGAEMPLRPEALTSSLSPSSSAGPPALPGLQPV